MTNASRFLLGALAVAGVGVLPACGGDGGAQGSAATTSTPRPAASTSSPAPSLPVTITGADGNTVTVSDVSRIIPVNGDIAEVVYALGLGDHVVATDISATYPPEAATKPSIGYQRTLIGEQVIGLSPTVVIGNTLAGPPGVLDEIRRVGIPLVIVDYPATLEGTLDKVRLVAAALGVPERGAALVASMQAEIDAATVSVDAVADHPRAVFLYLRGDNVQQVAGKGTVIDALLQAAGAIDVGSELGIDDFEPLTAEAFVKARPDVIVVTTTGLESVGGVDGLVALPAIAATPAGRDGRILAYEDQYLLGGGPRVGEVLAELVRDLHHPTPGGS